MKKWPLFLLSLALLGCNTREAFDGPNSYKDDFESYTTAADLIDVEDQQWSFFQNTGDQNEISVTDQMARSGTQSIRFASTDDSRPAGVSKASLKKQFMAFWEGEVVTAEFWIYIEGTEALEWLFIFDLEEKTEIGAGPGMRLALVDNQIVLEHKYPNPNVFQPDGEGRPFPRDQWVQVRFETLLSQKDEGYVRVFQDNEQVLEVTEWQTLPRDILYAQQGTKGMYSQIEFGITAIDAKIPAVLYVDDVRVETTNP